MPVGRVERGLRVARSESEYRPNILRLIEKTAGVVENVRKPMLEHGGMANEERALYDALVQFARNLDFTGSPLRRRFKSFPFLAVCSPPAQLRPWRLSRLSCGPAGL